MTSSKPTYHHGDLRASLLAAATDLLREGGVSVLSMRKLADRVGVSRTAPYHHFQDKQALLSALAETGFRDYETLLRERLAGDVDPSTQLRRFLRCYIEFACAHPEIYNLMFGQAVWQSGVPAETLQTQAYGCFRRYVDSVATWQKAGLLPASVVPLRFAQLSWSTLHGMARLLIDGIYVDDRNVDELLTLAERLFCGISDEDSAATVGAST